MKVLVATSRTQGARDNDYNWCIEGELVRIGEVCARDRADSDGGCGCGRLNELVVRELPGDYDLRQLGS